MKYISRIVYLYIAAIFHSKSQQGESIIPTFLCLFFFKAQEIANARFPAVIKGEFDDHRKIPVLA